MAGFKAHDQLGIPVRAQERVDLHEIKLDIGEVTTTVEVKASTVHVATTSSDRTVSMGRVEIEDRRGQKIRTPLCSVSIGIVLSDAREFETSAQVAEVAAEVKGVAKRTLGSAWAVDRRRG